MKRITIRIRIFSLALLMLLTVGIASFTTVELYKGIFLAGIVLFPTFPVSNSVL